MLAVSGPVAKALGDAIGAGSIAVTTWNIARWHAELERGRQLQAGLPAERELQLPPRDSRLLEKNRAKEQQDVERGVQLRRSLGRGR